MFRTPSINPAFTHNLLTLKKIRLLEIEEPPVELLPVSLSGERGIRTPFSKQLKFYFSDFQFFIFFNC